MLRPTLAIAAVLVASQVTAATQQAVLQLTSYGPAAGSIDSSAPSLSCATTCSVTVAVGDMVALTATPGAGNRFESWAGDCVGSAPTCALVMDGTKVAVASFRAVNDRYTVIHRFLEPGVDGSGPGGLLVDGGFLYGLAGGGLAGSGNVFRELPDGSGHVILHHFVGDASDGAFPSNGLIDVGGVLFGMTTAGGSADLGTIFKVNPDGSGFALVHSFAGGAGEGRYPVGALLEVDGALYGTTGFGGSADMGTVFKIDPDGSAFAVLHSFIGGNADGSFPFVGVVAAGGALYGTTSQGGPAGLGTVFRIGPDGSGYAVLHAFAGVAQDGSGSSGGLTASGGVLFGMTTAGGAHGYGTIFKIGLDGGGFGLVYSFTGGKSDGWYAIGPLLALGGALYGVTLEGGTNGGGVLFRIATDGSGVTALHSFGSAGGDGYPPSGVLAAYGGTIYGTASFGGAHNDGTVFSIDSTGGAYATLHSFDGGASGFSGPTGPPVVVGSALVGTTNLGAGDLGELFVCGEDGSGYSVLHAFRGGASDGATPVGSPIDLGGVLYGTTLLGGGSGNGTVFRSNPDGSGFALLHTFAGPPSDGKYPANSLLGLGGALYGTTVQGGGASDGTVFRIGVDGTGFGLLHSFSGIGADGSYPDASLVAVGGTLYGTTGSPNSGTIFKINPDGSGFGLLHSFAGGAADGSFPSGALITVGETLYGTTIGGGSANLGTVFRINSDGSGFAVLHSFAGGASDGSTPYLPLIVANGILFGITYGGGAAGVGVIFAINPDGTGFSVLHSFEGASSGALGATRVRADSGGGGLIYEGGLVDAGGVLFGASSAGGRMADEVLFKLDISPLACVVTCSATVPPSGTAGTSVSFQATAAASNCRGEAVSYLWIFDDGTNSTEQSPAHVYNQAKTYNWSLVVTSGSAMCTKSGSITISSAAQQEDVWVVVASNASGINGSKYESDLGLLNTGTGTASAHIKGAIGGANYTKDVTLAAGQQLVLANILQQLGASGSGAIEVTVPLPETATLAGLPVKVTARTYNQVAANAACYPQGTQGQDYIAATSGDGLSAGQSAWLGQLTENASYRTNIGVTNTGSTAMTGTVFMYDAAGHSLGSYAVSLTPGQWQQVTQPFKSKATPSQTSMAAGYAKLTVTAGSGVLSYASVLNNVTNDPTTINPLVADSGTDVWIAVGSHAGGLNNSQYRSDLGLLNSGGASADVQVKVYIGGTTYTKGLAVAAGAQVILTDVVGQLGASGSGAIEIVSDHPLKVTARTYNQVAANAACYANGTQGQDYLAATASQGFSAGQTAWLAGLTENASYRTNIGVTNTGNTNLSATVSLYDAGGHSLGSYAVSLTPGQWQQVTQPFKNRATPSQMSMAAGYAKVTINSGSGAQVYASVLNNITNDPTTINPLL